MFDTMEAQNAASKLEALGNISRLEIYRTLVRAGRTGLPVGELQKRIGIPASTLSHHLKRLVDTGLASQERQATTLICRADFEEMSGLLGFLVDECCADEACCAEDTSVGRAQEEAA